MDKYFTAGLNCEKAQELISSALDGCIDKKEIRLLFLHLGDCDLCRKEMNDMARIDAVVRGFKSTLKPLFLSEPFHKKIKENILSSDKDKSLELLEEGNIFDQKKLEEFLHEVRNNQTLLQALQNSDKEKFVQITKELGFSFSMSALKKMLLTMKKEPENDELSDEDLENVAGGTTSTDFGELMKIGNQLLDLID